MECLQLNSSGKIIHRPVLHRMSRLFFFFFLIASYLLALGVTLHSHSAVRQNLSAAADPIQNPSALSPLWFG